MDLGSAVLTESAADLSDTPAGRARRTEWQHRIPEGGDETDAGTAITVIKVVV